jgi:hypothetical protein
MEYYITRDKSGFLMVSEKEPKLWENKKEYVVEDGEYMILPEDEFPEVTFENGPMKVELKLIIKK